ncbi:hypothetical protein B0J12DRAFT_765834 [Macrophomina phaseolina]|uniref:Uncharacterized protein n=1 Tax=Macrophomina phaseolina TaxID=35725 RepID=A0ABQ8FXS1_9PEZI|nr:hypothetical protein B0J12DRAFT_765834 [Macrophomina phaseolina]
MCVRAAGPRSFTVFQHRPTSSSRAHSCLIAIPAGRWLDCAPRISARPVALALPALAHGHVVGTAHASHISTTPLRSANSLWTGSRRRGRRGCPREGADSPAGRARAQWSQLHPRASTSPISRHSYDSAAEDARRRRPEGACNASEHAAISEPHDGVPGGLTGTPAA